MSSWLKVAALAGSAAVELQLDRTIRDYQSGLEQSYGIALSGRVLGGEVRRAREAFDAVADRECCGQLSGTAGASSPNGSEASPISSTIESPAILTRSAESEVGASQH